MTFFENDNVQNFLKEQWPPSEPRPNGGNGKPPRNFPPVYPK